MSGVPGRALRSNGAPELVTILRSASEQEQQTASEGVKHAKPGFHAGGWYGGLVQLCTPIVDDVFHIIGGDA